MDAIVTAGGLPRPDDPLYPYTQGNSKALLKIAGKPMIQWVLDALDKSEHIEHIVVIGLDDPSAVWTNKPLNFIPDQGGMLENILVGADRLQQINPQIKHMLVVSSDIPAITVEGVDWLVKAAMESEYDIYYTVIPRKVMEQRFPQSRRSYVRLKDVEVCGGDCSAIQVSALKSDHALWQRLIRSRKNAIQQAAIIGFDTLLLLLLRRLTLQEALEKVASRFDLRAQALLSPYAELGMDVDKPGQLELLKAELQNRTGDVG